LIERDQDELAAIETLDNGKAFTYAKFFDVKETAFCFRYFGGWAGNLLSPNPYLSPTIN